VCFLFDTDIGMYIISQARQEACQKLASWFESNTCYQVQTAQAQYPTTVSVKTEALGNILFNYYSMSFAKLYVDTQLDKDQSRLMSNRLQKLERVNEGMKKIKWAKEFCESMNYPITFA